MQVSLSSRLSILGRSGNGIAAALKATAIAAFLVAALSPALAQEAVPESANAFDAVPEIATAPIAKRPAVLPGTLVVPESNRVNAADKGKRAHTNFRYIVAGVNSPLEAPPYSGYAYETPASLACIYHVVTPVAGCNPNVVTNTPAGGSQTIAIVDAYDDPEAEADLAYFSDQFGLPFNPAKFTVVYASGSQPETDFSGNWEIEESLDIEYAHAMAPNARLYLVEAASNYNSDLFTAVQVATNLVVCGKTEISSSGVGTCPAGSKGAGEVSMSWGGSEFSGETSYDSALTTPNVVYVASSGDSAGVIYPSASPNVIAVGGTTTARSSVTGNLIKEISWADGGGGVSAYEKIPTYQSTHATVVSAIKAATGATTATNRAVPDISADANPYTGVWVYDSFPVDGYYEGNWWWVGGTSLSAPTMAGIINAASTANKKFAASSAAELTTIYSTLASATNYAADFNDISYGYCGYYSGTLAGANYDLCTGVGSPLGPAGK
jgi:subtilase family serine protease